MFGIGRRNLAFDLEHNNMGFTLGLGLDLKDLSAPALVYDVTGSAVGGAGSTGFVLLPILS